MLLLPQLTENVVFAIRKASHSGRRSKKGHARGNGRVITVFSPKGGTGKTVTATNLSVCFAKNAGKKTLLLDLDLQFGDAAIMLGIEPEKTIQDLVTAPGELDPEKLAGYTTRHSSGLDVLPAPIRPEDAELVTEAKLVRLMEVAKESYEVIVVDTSPFFHGPMLATLDQSDDLLLVCGLDVPTIKNVRLSLQTLQLLSFPVERVRVVLNRANSNVGMKKGEVEAALETKIRFEVPERPRRAAGGQPLEPGRALRPEVGLRPRRCARWRRPSCRRRPPRTAEAAVPRTRTGARPWAFTTASRARERRGAQDEQPTALATNPAIGEQPSSDKRLPIRTPS